MYGCDGDNRAGAYNLANISQRASRAFYFICITTSLYTKKAIGGAVMMMRTLLFCSWFLYVMLLLFILWIYAYRARMCRRGILFYYLIRIRYSILCECIVLVVVKVKRVSERVSNTQLSTEIMIIVQWSRWVFVVPAAVGNAVLVCVSGRCNKFVLLWIASRVEEFCCNTQQQSACFWCWCNVCGLAMSFIWVHSRRAVVADSCI